MIDLEELLVPRSAKGWSVRRFSTQRYASPWIENALLAREAALTFRARLAVLGVRAFAWLLEADVLRVWTILDQDDIEIQAKVYEAEANLSDRFPGFTFDFLALFRHGRNVEAMQPVGSLLETW